MKNIWHDGDRYKLLNKKVQFLNALELCQKIEILPSSKVLDLGCGTGDLLLYLAKIYKDSSFCGIDRSKNMLMVARQNARKENLNNIKFVQADIVTMEINQCFDIIVSNASFHWFKDEIKGNIFSELLNFEGVIAVHTAGTDVCVGDILDREEKIFLGIIEDMGLSKYYNNYIPFQRRRLNSEELANVFNNWGFSTVEHGFVLRKTYFSDVNEYIDWLDCSGNIMFKPLPKDIKRQVYNVFVKSISTDRSLFAAYHASSFCVSKAFKNFKT